MNRRKLLVTLASVLLLLTVGLSAQGPFSAQIQAAIRALLASNATVTGTWTFTTPPIGTGGFDTSACTNGWVLYKSSGDPCKNTLTFDAATNVLDVGAVSLTSQLYTAFVTEQGTPVIFAGSTSQTGPAVMGSAHPEFYLGRYRGTPASPTAVQDGDLLGDIRFVGFNPGDGITASVDEGAFIQAIATAAGDEYFVAAKLQFVVTDTGGTQRNALVLDYNNGSSILTSGTFGVASSNFTVSGGTVTATTFAATTFAATDVHLPNATGTIGFRDAGNTSYLTIYADASDQIVINAPVEIPALLTAGGVRLFDGEALKTDTTTAHTALFQAYDVKAVVGGMLGMFVALALGVGAYHAWTDHRALHAIIDMINRNAQQQAKPPTP